VAQQRDSIDLRTLEEVHRLLASSDFATAGDLLDRSGGPVDFEPMALPRRPERVEATSAAPLPRRR
jgi:hypothetical protein